LVSDIVVWAQWIEAISKKFLASRLGRNWVFVSVFDILEYACGLRPTKIIILGGSSSYAGKLDAALILNQNPF
jgi:hypothetical protein